jgi:nucleoside-diphosphate-sugar epimerase
MHVADAVSACLVLAEAMRRPEIGGEAFNFSSEHPISVVEIVDKIRRLMDREDLTPRIIGQTPDVPAVMQTSSRKARQRLGWSARAQLEIGLQQTIEWYQVNLCRLSF